MYASTGEAALKEKGDRVVGGLADCQQQLGSGYLSAYPETFFDRVEKLQPVWAPYYTLHKIYAGLLDMYVYAGNAQALEVCRRFADWVIARNARLTDEQMQSLLNNEHGGMNEALANLYALTGESKYLAMAERFNHLAVIGPAAHREDKLTGLHANTQIPKFVGTARLYELTGQERYRIASTFFWDTVVKERSYVIGGHSDGEAFSPKETLSQALGPNTTETCNTYNVLKLTRHLFCWSPSVEYADYYERALYNHILSSQEPTTGMMCYYVPLRSGSHKSYSTPLDSFWCCTGTGLENHAKYGDSIYFHDGGDGLFVNLFIASELDWTPKGVRVRQETQYPDEPATRLRFTCERPTPLTLRLRHPAWSTQGFEVSVNGQRQSTSSRPGDWAVISRRWKTGDQLEATLPFALRTEGFRDQPRRFAFLHGPLVLCAEVDPQRPFPAVVAPEGHYLEGLTSVPGKPSTFTVASHAFRIPGAAGPAQVTLEPFFRMHGRRPYVVYWDAFGEDEWRVKEAAYLAELERLKALEARTVDLVTPGFDQNERDHQFQGEKTGAGDFSGRKWRHAPDGGWFAYAVKVLPDQPLELSATYWGSDGGGREFDVLVDGRKIATQRLESNRPGEFFEVVYPVPTALTRGKDQVVVRFQGHPNRTAGGVFGLRVLKPAR